MKIIQKIRALFNFNGKREQMELIAAEVVSDGVFLHPTDDSEHTFFVKTSGIDIIINPDSEIMENDIKILDNKKKIEQQESFSETEPNIPPKEETPSKSEVQSAINAEDDELFEEPGEKWPKPLSKYMPKKKRLTMMLYTDEYEKIMEVLNNNGYKKVEYLLACMTSAKKQSMEATYKRLTEDHAKRHKVDLAEAKRAREEEKLARQAEAEVKKA